MDPKILEVREALREPNDAKTEKDLFLYLAGELPPRLMDNTSTMNLIGE
jgi:hypothetical protein